MTEGTYSSSPAGDGPPAAPAATPVVDRADRPDRAERAPVRIDQAIGKVLPHSLEAEVCVIGSMAIDPAAIDVVVQIVKSEDFFRPAHRILFDTLVRMQNSGKPIDLVALKEELARAQVLERIGGDDFLVAMVDGVPSTANVEFYARTVRDKALLRSLICANQQIMQDAYDSQEEPRQVIDRAEATIFQIASRQIGDAATTIAQLLQQTFETLSNADGSMVTGVATGYFKLDELTAGFQRGEMIVLAARPSMGKTALALNMAEYMAVEDKSPVMIYSLEMSKEQLAQRFLCARARYSSSKLRRGNISPEDWTRLQMAAGDLEKAPIFIDDSPELNILQLRAKTRRMVAGHGIKCIFVDYLQLMSAVGRIESRQQQISEISRGLKALAREVNIPVVVLSQLNRGPEDREGHRPRMSDLRESGAIEQDADVVILMHREDYYHRGEQDYSPTNITDAIVAKQRNGPIDTVPLTFLPECVRFENFASEHGYGGY